MGWLRVDFVNDEWLLIDEVQSDLINAVDLAKRFIVEPNLESLMSKYKSETVKQKIRDMGATEQMFQALQARVRPPWLHNREAGRDEAVARQPVQGLG